MALLFNTLYLLVILTASPYLLVRILLTRRLKPGLSAKLFGTKQVGNPDSSRRIWFHGVSVGEIHLLSTVIAAFRRRHPDWDCIVSTTTETGMSEARKRFPDLQVIYWPLDFSWAVRRTLRSLRPQIIVLAESEIWPNFVHLAQKYSIPVAIINGRLSPRSARRYRWLRWLARPLLFSRITRFAMQSPEYASLLRSLGVAKARITVTGSVKYDGVLRSHDRASSQHLARILGIVPGQRIWVAGSTHAPEEKIVLQAFRLLHRSHPGLRLMLVPRAPARFDEVARLIEDMGFHYVRRSQIQVPTTGTEPVILLDSMGELNAAWGLADVGFTGGSLENKRGGQSMIEPAGLGVPVVFGPSTWNFRDAAERLIQAGAARRITSVESMVVALRQILDNASLRASMSQAALDLVQSQQGATARTLDLLDELLGHYLEKQAA